MTSRLRLPLLAALLAAFAPASGGAAQSPAYFASADASRAAVVRATRDQQAAARRAALLEQEAARATRAADRTAREAAALAARIQQSEAGLAAAEARLRLIGGMGASLRARLAERQRPVVRLTAALQNLSRRPMALTLLRPGSVTDLVHLRAVLASTLPVVTAQTAALRAELDRLQALRREAVTAIADSRQARGELEERRRRLAAVETRQRLASRARQAVAAREADRALALAEEARDLDALVGRLDAAAGLRQQLARLPGPIIRPPRPSESLAPDHDGSGPAAVSPPPARYQLPVTGQTVAGFGAPGASGALSQGLTIAPLGGAMVVAPAAGRVAFAGPYRGYGRIAIIEHDGGWISLVAGLARVDAATGEELVGGAPIGIAPAVRPAIMLELRRDGAPVNPADYVR